MPNNESDVKFKVLNMSAEAKKAWGPKWGEPEISYEFGDRKFNLQTGDSGIYANTHSIGNPIQVEIGGDILDEDGGQILQE